jgi:hypothetical protein
MRSLLSAVVALAFAALAHSPGHAATLLSENFDELSIQIAATGTIGQFQTIDGTNVDVIGTAFAGCTAPESGNCVDLGGSTGNAAANGVLQSILLFGPGTYLLSFDLVGSQRGQTDSTTVTLGNYDQTFVLTSNDDSSGIVANALVTVTTPSNLTFTENPPCNTCLNDVGNELDNVLVTSGPNTAVPEPASLAVFGAGLIALGAIRRRRKDA